MAFRSAEKDDTKGRLNAMLKIQMEETSCKIGSRSC